MRWGVDHVYLSLLISRYVNSIQFPIRLTRRSKAPAYKTARCPVLVQLRAFRCDDHCEGRVGTFYLEAFVIDLALRPQFRSAHFGRHSCRLRDRSVGLS